MGPLLILIAAGGIVASVTFLGTTLYYRSQWLRARDVLDELRDRQLRATGSDESLQRAVEAIAIEVERVSESQRYIAKLLANNAGRSVPATPDRTDRQLREPTPVP
jgi:hypothetical protein